MTALLGDDVGISSSSSSSSSTDSIYLRCLLNLCSGNAALIELHTLTGGGCGTAEPAIKSN